MKICLSRRFATISSPQQDRRGLWWNRAGQWTRVGAVVLLTAAFATQAGNASAAPKKTGATPTPTTTPAPTPTATPMLTATPAATPTPDPNATPNYNGQQQAQYIAMAKDAFIAQRTAKSQPFLDAHQAMDAAGGMSAKGLKTKEDITARRDLLAKTIAANADYLEFTRNQDVIYRAELAKTPLIPNDIEAVAADYAKMANTPVTTKLRETDQSALKTADEMLAFLEKKFGAWSVSEAGRITFKKKSDVGTYSALGNKYNAEVSEVQKLREQLTAAAATASPTATPGTTPTASPTVGAKP